MTQKTSIYQKIFNVQHAIEKVVKGQENPYFKSKYADINDYLDVLMPALKSEGLVVTQPLTSLDGKPAIQLIITDPQTEEFAVSGEPFLLPDIQDPQKMGSAITYYRRYQLQSYFALRAEDDDANKASQKESDVYEMTKKAVASAQTLKGLAQLEEKIQASEKFTAKQKEDLLAMVADKIQAHQ